MGRKKNLGQRVLIIKLAYQMFLEDGYDKVTTKQIAEQCNMAHSLLHYYYPTKQDLLVDIINTMGAKLYSYVVKEGVELTDKLFVFGLCQRVFFEVLSMNQKLIGIYRPVFSDGLVLQRVTKYMVEKVGVFPEDAPEKALLSPYLFAGSMGQTLLLYTDFELKMEFKEAINIALDILYGANGITKAGIHAKIGTIDMRGTQAFVRGFLNEFTEMMYQ